MLSEEEKKMVIKELNELLGERDSLDETEEETLLNKESNVRHEQNEQMRKLREEMIEEAESEPFGMIVMNGRAMDKMATIESGINKMNQAMVNIGNSAEAETKKMQEMEELKKQLEVIEMKVNDTDGINRQTSFGGLFKQQHKRKNYIKGQRR